MTDPPAYYIGGEVVIALASVLGNVMVVWAVKINRCLRDTTFYYVVSLALADIAVGAFAIPLAIMISTGIQTRFYGCLMSACMMLVLTQSSILALLAIAIDRYLRVKIPLSYKRMVTRKRAGGAVIACWLVAIIVGLTPMFGWNNLMDHHQSNSSQELNPIINCTFVNVISMNYMVYFNFFGCVLAPLVLMFVIYLEIFYMIHKQLNKKFNKTTSQADPGRYYGKELKLAKSLALVLFLFAVSWLPLHILNCISLFKSSSEPETESSAIHLFNAILLSHGNSAVNPVVYAFRIKKFRTAFIKIWKQYVCCKKVNQWASKATRRRANPEQMMRRTTDI